jgi:hypothetical protein
MNPKLLLKEGMVVDLKRKPTNENNATIVTRRIKSINFKKKTIDCDDNITYKFKDIIKTSYENYKFD